jgi:hypothetical protein
MFLLRAHDGSAPSARAEIARYVERHAGTVLLATQGSSLIVAMPPGNKAILEACPQVAFIGAVNLDPAGKAAVALRRRFAVNTARQLAARPQAPQGGAQLQHAGP